MATDTPSEQEIREEDIPRLASLAGRLAYQRALAAGKSVVVAEAGTIYRVFPDGRKEVVKRIAPPTPTVQGKHFKIP